MTDMKVLTNQPLINIGVIGHVADGKSTIVKALTNKATQQHSSEQERGITIKIGYANAKIFKCGICDAPMCYQSTDSSVGEYECKICGEICDLVNHVSFVDNPGHHAFMTTMMNGTSVMDYAILVESAENGMKPIGIPAPQTREHLEITERVGIPTKIVCMNKFDLVPKTSAHPLVTALKDYLNTTSIDPDMPIIPMSATLGCNIDVLCEMLAKLPIPSRDISCGVKMLIVRSFNVNHPKTVIADLKGGVVGGSLIRGKLSVGTTVYIYPGYVSETKEDSKFNWSYTPLKSKILSINSEKTPLDSAVPGGLIGVQLDIDPALAGVDKLVGQIVVSTDTVIKVYDGLKLDFKPMNDSIMIAVNDVLSVNVNSNNIICTVYEINDTCIMLELKKPVCVEIGDRVTLSRIVDSVITVLGCGVVLDGLECELC
jgi:translation initiation factor 2 subunit 3